MRTNVLMFSVLFFMSNLATAQDSHVTDASKTKLITFTSGFESGILQFAKVESQGVSMSTIPRFTYFFNSSVDANMKLGNHLSIFTGLAIKNLGLIIRENDSTRVKHRVYTLGAPLGVKVYMANKKVIMKVGADLNMAFNYRWKTINGKSKTTHSEFFSDKTSLFFPSVFAGISVQGVSVTASYYLNNFFHQSVQSLNTIDARLFTIGFGLNLDNQMEKLKKKQAKKKAL
jgi:hypothetical protein